MAKNGDFLYGTEHCRIAVKWTLPSFPYFDNAVLVVGWPATTSTLLTKNDDDFEMCLNEKIDFVFDRLLKFQPNTNGGAKTF